MFSQVSVCSPGGVFHPPLGRPPSRHPLGRHPSLGRHSPGQTLPCPVHAGIRSTSRRYASHWNAFLFTKRSHWYKNSYSIFVFNSINIFTWERNHSFNYNLIWFCTVWFCNLTYSVSVEGYENLLDVNSDLKFNTFVKKKILENLANMTVINFATISRQSWRFNIWHCLKKKLRVFWYFISRLFVTLAQNCDGI